MKDIFSDERTVMTLDAGGTNFVFSALQSGEEVAGPLRLPAYADNLELCTGSLQEGFQRIQDELKEPALAISFAFPGPADYPGGIIGDLPNLPAFRGGIPLGPMLEATFNLPVYINNDGDLFVFGEAIAGFLPDVNRMLESAGNPKRYRNLVGFTLGSGFGAGIYTNGRLLVGDNSIGAEVWKLSNRYSPERNVEEGVNIRSVTRFFRELTGMPPDTEISPKDIYEIAAEEKQGDRKSALQAYELMGKHLGDAMANLITLIDGLVVLGGGITGAARFFMPAVMDTLRGKFEFPPEDPMPRLVQYVFNLDDESDRMAFLDPGGKEIEVPGTGRRIYYDHLPKSAVGISRLGASRAISLGAYAFALTKLDT